MGSKQLSISNLHCTFPPAVEVVGWSVDHSSSSSSSDAFQGAGVAPFSEARLPLALEIPNVISKFPISFEILDHKTILSLFTFTLLNQGTLPSCLPCGLYLVRLFLRHFLSLARICHCLKESERVEGVICVVVYHTTPDLRFLVPCPRPPAYLLGPVHLSTYLTFLPYLFLLSLSLPLSLPFFKEREKRTRTGKRTARIFFFLSSSCFVLFSPRPARQPVLFSANEREKNERQQQNSAFSAVLRFRPTTTTRRDDFPFKMSYRIGKFFFLFLLFPFPFHSSISLSFCYLVLGKGRGREVCSCSCVSRVFRFPFGLPLRFSPVWWFPACVCYSCYGFCVLCVFCGLVSMQLDSSRGTQAGGGRVSIAVRNLGAGAALVPGAANGRDCVGWGGDGSLLFTHADPSGQLFFLVHGHTCNRY